MSPQASAIMKEAMVRADVQKHTFEQERPPRPATRSQLEKVQRHFNKPHGHPYILSGGSK